MQRAPKGPLGGQPSPPWVRLRRLRRPADCAVPDRWPRFELPASDDVLARTLLRTPTTRLAASAASDSTTGASLADRRSAIWYGDERRLVAGSNHPVVIPERQFTTSKRVFDSARDVRLKRDPPTRAACRSLRVPQRGVPASAVRRLAAEIAAHGATAPGTSTTPHRWPDRADPKRSPRTCSSYFFHTRNENATQRWRKSLSLMDFFGGRCRFRTCDPVRVKDVLYP